MKLDPVHRSLVAVDLEGYSRRQNLGQLELREALRRIMADAFDGVSIEIDPKDQQDQGDAFLVLVRPEISKVVLIDGLIREIENALRRCNRYRTKEGRIRLRVALHSGEVHLDGTGFPGEATVTVMRLIEAEQLKNALVAAPKDIVVIISSSLYQDVVVHGYGAIVPEEYVQVEIAVKNFRQAAWIRVPGCSASEVIFDTPAAMRSVTPTSQESNENKLETRSSNERGGLFNNASFGGPTTIGGGYTAGRDIKFNK